MSPIHNVTELLHKLSQPGGPSSGDLSQLLAQLLQLLESLPAGKDPLQALKKPGAWREVPITSNDLTKAIIVDVPVALDFTNVPPAVLEPQLTPQPLQGPDRAAWSQIKVLAPLQSSAS